MAALVMQGEHSSVASPIARAVIQEYYDKKQSPKTGPRPPEIQARLMEQVGHEVQAPAAQGRRNP